MGRKIFSGKGINLVDPLNGFITTVKGIEGITLNIRSVDQSCDSWAYTFSFYIKPVAIQVAV